MLRIVGLVVFRPAPPTRRRGDGCPGDPARGKAVYATPYGVPQHRSGAAGSLGPEVAGASVSSSKPGLHARTGGVHAEARHGPDGADAAPREQHRRSGGLLVAAVEAGKSPAQGELTLDLQRQVRPHRLVHEATRAHQIEPEAPDRCDPLRSHVPGRFEDDGRTDGPRGVTARRVSSSCCRAERVRSWQAPRRVGQGPDLDRPARVMHRRARRRTALEGSHGVRCGSY